jgi:HPt (histidine-containing phosphotransfer) domain-containing protein
MPRMNDSAFHVVVAKDLEDLIPVFMGNRKKELEALRVALAASDFDQLRQLGHRMKGVGNSYGFARISDFGKYVEDGARSGDRAALEAVLVQYRDYLAKVQITYE